MKPPWVAATLRKGRASRGRPAGLISKYVVKATNGWHHSFAFTMGGYPDVIRARPESSAVVEANCRRCHADLVDEIAHGRDTSCIRCHLSVGHLR